jgi:predicted NBD/HSP70 family sugar kinase
LKRVNRADPRIVRKINLHSIFSILRDNKSLGVSDISRLTGLSLSTVKSILNDLIEMNLVIEIGEGHSTGGRKPTLYDLNLKNIFVCGIELYAHFLKVGFLKLDGSILWDKEWAIQTMVPEELAVIIHEKILEGLQDLRISFDELIGIGICIPGLTNLERKSIMLDVQFGWTDVPFGSILQKILPVPVFIAEDANVKMIAEIEYGIAKNMENFLFLLIGTGSGKGIGCGIVLNNAIIEGSKGFAGEVGHTIIDPNGPICSCGRKGCWEAQGSISQMIEKLNEIIPNIRIKDITELNNFLRNVPENNIQQKVKSIFNWFVNIQAEGIANLIHIFNPEFIVIGGEITILGDLFIEPLRERVKQKVMKPFQESYRIEFSKMEKDSSILGASALVIQQAISIKQDALV